jgi:hypothetical protein
VGFFADLFTPRTYTCETCQAHKYTITVQNEEIEYLRGLLDAEREKVTVRPVAQPIKPGFEGNIRKSRVPWSRKQADLENQSAREARELWKKRVEEAEKVDGSKTG